MNNEMVERVRNIVAKQLRVPVEKVTAESTFADLGMDSLDAVNLIFDVEEEFDVSIDDKDAKSITSVAQMVDGVEKLLARKSVNATSA
jgi:acyl carrier protein